MHMKTMHKLLRNRKAMVGLILAAMIVFVAAFAPYLTPYSADAMDTGQRFEPPSRAHPMGTDFYGRDVFSRVLFGTRISLWTALVVAGAATLLGLPMGLAAGYFGGWTDALFMRLTDVVFCFPWLLMALTVGSIIGPGVKTVIISLGIVYSPQVARIARGEAMAVRVREFVEAARASGGGSFRIMLRHVLPNCMAPLIVQFSLVLGFAVLAEAGISYLGFGIQPPTPSWGLMLSEGRDYMMLAPHISIFPGIAIMLFVVAYNFLGDGLRDVLDPRMKV
ncbi:MAG TPA: ABC transporter permease [Firmicutes bacterium]|nr:ABC transporter permease [Bacillota bacterium]